MRLGRVGLMNLEQKLKALYKTNGISFMGWVRGEGVPGYDEYWDKENFRGVPFKDCMNNPLPYPINECKDVAELIELKEQGIIQGYVLFPMLPIHFDNLDFVKHQAEYTQDRYQATGVVSNADIDEQHYFEWKKGRGYDDQGETVY